MNMTTATTTTARLADQAAQKADDAIKATQRVANDALNGLSESVENARAQGAPKLIRMAEQAESLIGRSAEVMRDGTQQLRDKAVRAQDVTVGYIKDEPIKSVLIAAATGAVLMALVTLASRSRAAH